MKILITAGPTWIKIDEVRMLTSIFTGATGLYLAEEFKKIGHSVTILINHYCLNKKIKGMRVIPFRYFEEFKEKVIAELKKNQYDVMIHSAAVSDYELKSSFNGKIPSGRKELVLKLTPAKKIIRIIRKLAKKTILIQFKLEMKRKGLLGSAYKSLTNNQSDFVVANALEDLKLGYRAFLIDKNKAIITLNSKKALFYALRNAIII